MGPMGAPALLMVMMGLQGRSCMCQQLLHSIEPAPLLLSLLLVITLLQPWQACWGLYPCRQTAQMHVPLHQAPCTLMHVHLGVSTDGMNEGQEAARTSFQKACQVLLRLDITGTGIKQILVNPKAIAGLGPDPLHPLIRHVECLS